MTIAAGMLPLVIGSVGSAIAQHQGVGNVPSDSADGCVAPTDEFSPKDVLCHEQLGGLLRHYERKAAWYPLGRPLWRSSTAGRETGRQLRFE